MSKLSYLHAVALAILVAACGTALPSASSAVSPTSSPPAATPTTSTAPSTVPAPATTAPGGSVGEAAQAFQTWVGYIAAGDEQAAWDGLAPTSQAAVGRDQFARLMIEMSEGWAAWSRATDVTYSLSEDEAGRSVLHVHGTVTREGMTETTENTMTVVVSGEQVLMSPFEEFGNVAEGIRQDLEGVPPPPVPADSGQGRRIVYSNTTQRVWLIDKGEELVDSYLVSGKPGVPAPGTYEVFSKSETAYAGHDGITMRYMVRFAHGDDLAIGFHSIPNDGTGQPLQREEQLGEYHSAGCVRQSLEEAAFLYDWAPVGTTVVVLA
ncbi:MAG: L,D-transpeptidase [Acidimicrobiia bacterium]